jgi:hypothetical protein
VCMRIMHDSVGDEELLQSDRGGERRVERRDVGEVQRTQS